MGLFELRSPLLGCQPGAFWPLASPPKIGIAIPTQEALTFKLLASY